jgi:hypothetical protein
MPTKDETETVLAGPLSAALITVAVISLPAILLVDDPEQTFVDEILVFVGLLSLISAARIIDREYDKAGVKFIDRFSVSGGGYPLFCIALAGMSLSFMLLDATINKCDAPYFTWPLAAMTAICIFGLLMSDAGSLLWLIGAACGGIMCMVFPRLFTPCG